MTTAMLVLVRDNRQPDNWHIEAALDRYASKTVCHEWVSAGEVERRVIPDGSVPYGFTICGVCLDQSGRHRSSPKRTEG